MKSSVNELCQSCVYLPQNLPATAYSEEDYCMLQEKQCAYDLLPGSGECALARKTSCTIVDLQATSEN